MPKRKVTLTIVEEPLPRRPKRRGDCEPCRDCQTWRDGTHQYFPGTLACGHDYDQAVAHSRPCLFVGCHHSLYLDVHPVTGEVKQNFEYLEPDQMHDSCVLDVVEEQGGETTLDIVGAALNVTRERARQIESYCLKALGRTIGDNGFRQLVRDAILPEHEQALPYDPIPLPSEAEVVVPHQSRSEVRARILAARAAAAALISIPAPQLPMARVFELPRLARTGVRRQLVLVRFCA